MQLFSYAILNKFFLLKRKINTDSFNSNFSVSWSDSDKSPISFPIPFLPNNFSPWFVTGFVDGDGTFGIFKNGNSFSCKFRIGLHLKDAQLLFLFQIF
jgi:hypothetical protein